MPEPLGVTAEIGRLARRGGSAIGMLPARLEGLEGLKGCRAVLSDQWITDSGLFAGALAAGSLAAALLSGEFRPRPGKPRSHFSAFLCVLRGRSPPQNGNSTQNPGGP